MKEAIKKITDLQKRLNEIESNLDNVRNCREYDILQAEKAMVLFDLMSASDEFARVAKARYDIHEDSLSNNAQNIVLNEMANRIGKAIPN